MFAFRVVKSGESILVLIFTSQVSDAKCEGEDRLLMCEMKGGTVGATLFSANAIEPTFDPAFKKTTYNSNVSRRNIRSIISQEGCLLSCGVKFKKTRLILV